MKKHWQNYTNSYSEWRMTCLKRDDYTCQFCKKRGGKLQVDHPKPFSRVKNFQPLCFDCHKKITDSSLWEISDENRIDLRKVFIETLLEHEKDDKRIVVITMDVGFNFLERLDGTSIRIVNMGITEFSTMITASILARQGFRVYIYSMSNFLLFRAFEAVRNAVGYHNSPVRLMGVSGSKGYGFLGMSHCFTPNEDIKMLDNIPNIRAYVPKTEKQAKSLITRIHGMPFPAYIRL